jgi:hypothetical protein
MSFILRLFIVAKDRHAIIGDLEEEFWTEILPEYGLKRARYWYLIQAMQTIVLRNPICRWLLVTGIVCRVGQWIMRNIVG